MSKPMMVPADDADALGRMLVEDCFPAGTPIMLFLPECEAELGQNVIKKLGLAEEGNYWACPIRNGMGNLREAFQVFGANFEMYELA